jgi:serpin B
VLKILGFECTKRLCFFLEFLPARIPFTLFMYICDPHNMLKRLLFLAAISSGFVTSGFALDGAAKSNNEFCFSLLEQNGGTKENQIFSPFSIWSALAMTSAGAEAETLQQMEKVLALPAKGSHELVSQWSDRLKNVAGVKMKIANRLWGRKDLPFRPDFLKLTNKHYGAGLETVDFTGDPNGSRQQINHWVSDNTEGKIKDLLGPGTILPSTQLVLTNAIYFKGEWVVPFKASNTQKRDFILATGKKVEPETMSDLFPAGYMEDDRLQAVKLRYQGGQMAMIVVLPRKSDALAKSSFLNADGFAKVLSGIKDEKRVVVQMPKFEASGKLQLSRTLKAMGMSRAFEDDAQFGRMCEDPVKISEVIHRAWIEVAEKGTEAAAATAVTMMRATAMPAKEDPPKRFIADHPFLYFVIDDRNGGIVFAGSVVDPT